jgi:hypothetical protein
MKSLYHAYQTYETRVARGEFSVLKPARKPAKPILPAPVEASLGDLMIRLGLKLKRHAMAGKSMAWSPLTGNKP